MTVLLALPVLAIVLLLQTVVVSTLPLLSGFADLTMLVLVAWALQDRVRTAWIWAALAGIAVGMISAQPLGLALAGYLVVTGIARLVHRRVWQSPILAMFLVTFIGSLVYQAMVVGVRMVEGVNLPLADSLNLVIMPSTLLNLLLALPVYALVTDLAGWVYPEEVEV